MGVCTVPDVKALSQMPAPGRNTSDPNSMAWILQTIAQMSQMDAQMKQAMRAKMQAVGS